jgi:hypothetical protein
MIAMRPYRRLDGWFGVGAVIKGLSGDKPRIYIAWGLPLLDGKSFANYHLSMSVQKPTYEELLAKIIALDPTIAAAIDDVDETLIEEFKKLSFREKIRRASESAETLAGFEKR